MRGEPPHKKTTRQRLAHAFVSRRFAKSAALGFPRLVLTHTTWRKPPCRCVAVSPFLTGNPSKGEAQVEHLFKTARQDIAPTFLYVTICYFLGGPATTTTNRSGWINSLATWLTCANVTA
jgi:hypothetical protein